LIRFASLGVALAAALTFAAPASAQSSYLPKPWRPAAGDSITQWAIEGRNLLAESNSPELGDREVVGYRWVDKVAKAYFHSLGPHGMAAAGGISAFLDSLKLKGGSVVSDKVYPAFTFVTFDNPTHPDYASLSYLYWFRGDDVRSQPVYLKGGHDPELRVWWTGQPEAPWECGILYTMEHDRDSAPEFIFMRMVPTGAGWEPVQAGVDVDFGGKGTATFADLDNDGTPEIVSWVRGVPDSLFVPCNGPGCPDLLTERIFTLERGFELYDQRTVATPYATLVLFVRSLVGGKEAIAQSLVTHPAVVEKARALGWPKLHRRSVFRTIQPRGSTRWPDRLRFDYGPQGLYDTVLEVRFASNQGHWLIDDIVTLTSGGAADTTHTATTSKPGTSHPATHPHPHTTTTTTPKGAKAGGH
jgi:hypothetical protein